MNDNQEKIEKLYCLAQDRFHENDLPEAIVSLKALLALNFQHLDAHFLLALIYQKDQAFELSNQHFRTCIDANYKIQEIYKLIAFNSKQLALYTNALHELQKHLHFNPEDDDAYALLGDVYMLKELYHYAKKVYLEAIKMDAKKPLYYVKLAHVYQAQKDVHQAILETQKALLLDNDNHQTNFFLATLYASTQEYEKALNFYEKAISLNDSIALYHHNMAITLSQLKRKEEALEAQNYAINLEPQNSHFQKALSGL